ncbi:uncharacterized protein LOC136076061 [Hydra vulgaris]|uniref:Uncharacterized protein LOC136076061 n=1 Tax=Hydra vulgaris TaxID=6087 RepID=A0ABM4B9M1_HYDVU
MTIKENNAALFAKISKENNEKNKILNNLIISGLTESFNLEDDKEVINEVLTILKVSRDDVKVKKRLKKKKTSLLTPSISNGITNQLNDASLRFLTIREGGVAIYVKKNIPSFECKFSVKQISEQIWCQISIENDILLIGCIYRHRSTRNESNLQTNKSTKCAKALIDGGKFTSILIVSDFNHSDIRWSYLGGQCKSVKQSSQLFLDTINDCFLSQFVTEPTFINNTLNLVLLDDLDCIYNVTIGPPFGCTQKNYFHNSLLWDYRLKSSNKTFRLHKVNYIYNKSDYNAINEGQKAINWPYFFSNKSADESFELFKDAYIFLIEQHIPKFNVSFSLKKNDPKWFNSSIKAAINEKFRLFMKLHCASSKFKDTFPSTVTHSQSPIFPQRTEAVCSPFSSSLFNCCNIEKHLFALDISKAAGNDGIHPRSFDSGQVPSGWKLANITPIFKKGHHTDPGNYRPISITSAVGKIMEGIMRDVMTEHLVKHDLLFWHQHGFVRYRSCIINLLEVLDIITEALSDDCVALLILLDFAKAFDRVSIQVFTHLTDTKLFQSML